LTSRTFRISIVIMHYYTSSHRVWKVGDLNSGQVKAKTQKLAPVAPVVSGTI